MYEVIKSKNAQYRKKYILFNTIVTTTIITSIVAVLLIIYIDFRHIEHTENLVKLILLIISVLTVIIILILYGKKLKDDSLKSENYKEFIHIYNSIPITFNEKQKDQYIKDLSESFNNKGYKMLNTKSNEDKLTFQKNYFNPLLLTIISKKFILINSEELTLDYIKNKVKYELGKNMVKYNVLKSKYTYLCFISEEFSDDLIEYFKYDYQYKDEFLSFIIPIGIEISSGKIYFKKRSMFMPFNNQFNYEIYRVVGKDTKVFTVKLIVHYLSILMLWTSIISFLVYLNNTIPKHMWPNKYIIIGLLILILSSIIASLQDVTSRRKYIK
jgi:hypothetical protein